VLKVLSKFDLRRVCRVVGATPLARVGAPTREEMGWVDVFEGVEVGGDRVTVLRQEEEGDSRDGGKADGEKESMKTRTATIVLRGATPNHLDDLERTIDSGVACLKALLKDARLVPGAGATEVELARRVEVYGAGMRGLGQHAVKRYAAALEVVPRTLAENAFGGGRGGGGGAVEVEGKLRGKHEEKGGEGWGVDVEVRSPPFIFFLSLFLSLSSHNRTPN
jgi:chaperonin GroEL (HSP60 family)